MTTVFEVFSYRCNKTRNGDYLGVRSGKTYKYLSYKDTLS